MSKMAWDQIELQHRDDDDDEGNDNALLVTDDNDAGDTDNVFGADDMLAQMQADAAALGNGAWYATCDNGHKAWVGRPRPTYDLAMQEASEHDDQFHNGDPTATISA